MTPRIVTFIRLLRTQGLPVSVAESLDALHSVSQVGVHDRDLLRLTLRTALVKSHRDFPTFDAIFERFFTVPRRRRRRRGQPQAHTSTGVGPRPSPQQNGIPFTLLARPRRQQRQCTVPAQTSHGDMPRDGVYRDSPGLAGARRAGTGVARAYGSDPAVPSLSYPRGY